MLGNTEKCVYEENRKLCIYHISARIHTFH